MAKHTEQERQEAIDHLKKLGIKPGATIYTVVRHVSKSGMSRRISLHFVNKDKTYGDQVINISGYASTICGWRWADDGSIVIQGCGMDMGFEAVYVLGRHMFPNGFKVKGVGRNGDTSGHDNDGGYALKQRWM